MNAICNTKTDINRIQFMIMLELVFRQRLRMVPPAGPVLAKRRRPVAGWLVQSSGAAPPANRSAIQFTAAIVLACAARP